MADEDLLRVLGEIQRRGAIGRTSLPDAIAHSDRFVASIPADAATLIDLGAGGGLPGLVIAHRLRTMRVVLIERRAKRVDLLRFGARALGLADSVTVFGGDAAVYADVVGQDASLRADVVTARSFGPRSLVLETAAALIAPGGSVLISDAPGVADTGGPAGIALRFDDLGSVDGIRRFRVFHVEH